MRARICVSAWMCVCVVMCLSACVFVSAWMSVCMCCGCVYAWMGASACMCVCVYVSMCVMLCVLLCACLCVCVVVCSHVCMSVCFICVCLRACCCVRASLLVYLGVCCSRAGPSSVLSPVNGSDWKVWCVPIQLGARQWSSAAHHLKQWGSTWKPKPAQIFYLLLWMNSNQSNHPQ